MVETDLMWAVSGHTDLNIGQPHLCADNFVQRNAHLCLVHSLLRQHHILPKHGTLCRQLVTAQCRLLQAGILRNKT